MPKASGYRQNGIPQLHFGASSALGSRTHRMKAETDEASLFTDGASHALQSTLQPVTSIAAVPAKRMPCIPALSLPPWDSWAEPCLAAKCEEQNAGGAIFGAVAKAMPMMSACPSIVLKGPESVSLAVPPRLAQVVSDAPGLAPCFVPSCAASATGTGIGSRAGATPRAMAPPNDRPSFNELTLSDVQARNLRELAGASQFTPVEGQPTTRLERRDWMGPTVLVDVRHLRFCQSAIRPTFASGDHVGRPVLSLLESLRTAQVKPEQIEPLIVLRTREGLDVLCGNRRLYCLKRFVSEVGAMEVRVPCVVHDLFAQSTPRNLVMKYVLAKSCQDGEAGANVPRPT